MVPHGPAWHGTPRNPARMGATSEPMPVAGDPVKEDDVIAQIETDKVTLDVKYTAKEPGVVTQVMIAPGDVVQVGQMVANVEMGAVTPTAADVVPKAEAAPAAAPKPAAPAPTPKPAAAPVQVGAACSACCHRPGVGRGLMARPLVRRLPPHPHQLPPPSSSPRPPPRACLQ